MAIDLTPLWDFGKPELSEARLRDALSRATGDDALILQTQIARTYGLRGDFEAARAILRSIEPQIETASSEAKVRYHLELGRSFASAAHKPEALTTQDKARAKACFDEALTRSRAAQLDALAIDAIHMFAFVDDSPIDQLKWGRAALEVVLASKQADARRWEASVRNNIGHALHRLGRFDESLIEFQKALAIRERGANFEATRIARWMVAWTLRSLKRIDEALAIQLRLENENEAAGTPDRYVFEELEALYRDKGDTANAERVAQRLRAQPKP
jgi:tetratricopeptide (TPR) repeat protein